MIRRVALLNRIVLVGLVLLALVPAGCETRPEGRRAEPTLGAASAAATCSADSIARWVVTPDSLGPLPIDSLTVEHVRRVCPSARDSQDLDLNGGVPVLVLPGTSGGVLFIPVWGVQSTGVARGYVASVQVTTAAIRTRDGLGVGSTLEEVRKRLGSMVVVFGEETGAMAVPRSDPASGIGFALQGFGMVSQAGGGWVGDTLRSSDLVPGATLVDAIHVWSPHPPPPNE